MQILSLGREGPLKKGVATPCSSPAWEIHGQETGGPVSTGLQRVGHSHRILERVFKFHSVPVLQTSHTFFFFPCAIQ